MSNEKYELLYIDYSSEIPRAMILVIANEKPSYLCEIDVYGAETPVDESAQFNIRGDNDGKRF